MSEKFSDEWLRTNAYYHSQIKIPLAMYYGVDPSWMHERLQIMFALIHINSDSYEVESMTGMSQQRFTLFLENVWQWVVENGIPIQEYNNIADETRIKVISKD